MPNSFLKSTQAKLAAAELLGVSTHSMVQRLLANPNARANVSLQDLCEYRVGGGSRYRSRNVLLRTPRIDNFEERSDQFDRNLFAWKLARRLERRDHVEDFEGVWPLDFYRCEKRFGNPGIDIFNDPIELDDDIPHVYQAARKMRTLAYHRLKNANEVKSAFGSGRNGVRYAVELTREWYDPSDGTIADPTLDALGVGSHGVPISHYDESGDESHFIFRNSWGVEWGFFGLGAISESHFDSRMIECWDEIGPGLSVPYGMRTGVICLEWTWAPSPLCVYGREIVNAGTDERLAWSFCKVRDGYLDVEEFYVWPSERGRGYGKKLAEMVKGLAAELQLPLRCVVSFADTEHENAESLQIAGRLLDVSFEETQERWAHLFGTVGDHNLIYARRRPERPAFMLERLRPTDEQPLPLNSQHAVMFGTNRAFKDPARPELGFSNKRGTDLIMGQSTVQIPLTPRFGTRGKWHVTIWNRITGNHPQILQNRIFTGEGELGEALAPLSVEFGHNQHNLLFVHGYNVGFDDAITQAARFGVDMKIPGATFCFSWPSKAKLLRYKADGATVNASVKYLELFVEAILRQTGDAPLSIVVHSMGNRAIVRLMEKFSQIPTSLVHGRIRHLIFAAPDVDAEEFKNTVPSFVELPQSVTLYTTRGDVPLVTSETIHCFERAGLAPPVVTLDKMETVMVEGFNLFELGHSYFAEASSVLHDMFNLLTNDARARMRPGLTATRNTAGDEYWKLTVR